MTFEPHLRLTFSGTIQADEMFACNVSLVPDGSIWQDAASAVAKGNILAALIAAASGGWFTDLVSDVSAYFSRPGTHISGLARLKHVKIVAIGADGHYAGAPMEAAVDVGGTAQGPPLPFQISRKVTLLTAGDLGRVKGGWYLPTPEASGWDVNTNLWSTGVTGEVQASTMTFLLALQNAPGIDGVTTEGLRVVVASQGRHNKDGSVRLGPKNHDVTGVAMGRRLDVQRRRANKVSESRMAASHLE